MRLFLPATTALRGISANVPDWHSIMPGRFNPNPARMPARGSGRTLTPRRGAGRGQRSRPIFERPEDRSEPSSFARLPAESLRRATTGEQDGGYVGWEIFSWCDY